MSIHSIAMQDKHYNRDQNQENYFAQFESDEDIIRTVELEEDEWKPADPRQNRYHRFTNGVHGDDYIVRDPKNAGTDNYCNPDYGVIGHWWNDMVPYWFLGNTLDDNLKWYERLFGSNSVKDPEPDYKNDCNKE